MNGEKTLLRRTSLLLQLQAAHPAALPLQTLLCGLKLACPAQDAGAQKTLEGDLCYLEEKGFVSLERHEFAAAALRAKLSAKGLEYLEKSGF